MYEAYERYYRTGHYDERYPRPNSISLRAVLGASQPGCSILDIGAGNGRYAVPLVSLGYRVVAIEPSETARLQLRERVASLPGGNAIRIYARLEDVPSDLVAASTLALSVFGALGHMPFAERTGSLELIAAGMPRGARLVGSAANRHRRFHHEQRASPVPDGGRAPRFTYTRIIDSREAVFTYTAYSPREMVEELAAHGWHCQTLRAESCLPESVVTRAGMLGRIDRLVTPHLPALLGYGFLYEASNAPE